MKKNFLLIFIFCTLTYIHIGASEICQKFQCQTITYSEYNVQVNFQNKEDFDGYYQYLVEKKPEYEYAYVITLIKGVYKLSYAYCQLHTDYQDTVMCGPSFFDKDVAILYSLKKHAPTLVLQNTLVAKQYILDIPVCDPERTPAGYVKNMVIDGDDFRLLAYALPMQ